MILDSLKNNLLPTGIHEELPDDVYFRKDFVELYARPDEVDHLSQDDFSHVSAIRKIPETDWYDLETPHGYGGPVANNISALEKGISSWRERQRAAERVAEFIRVHPFINSDELRPHVDFLEFNRETVYVDLSLTKDIRRQYYRKGVRHSLKVAERALTLRKLAPSEWPLFRQLYEDGLRTNNAGPEYFYDDTCYQSLLAAPWSVTWVAESNNEPVGVACFLSSTPKISHYHLAGGNLKARETNANYLLLENAFDYFAAKGGHVMHLGGGRTKAIDDDLFRFKKKFSALKINFYIAGLIHDIKKFTQLGCGRPGKFIGYR